MITIPKARVTVEHPGAYYAEASELQWEPGYVPEALEIEGSDDVYHLRTADEGGFLYRNQHSDTLFVFND